MASPMDLIFFPHKRNVYLVDTFVCSSCRHSMGTWSNNSHGRPFGWPPYHSAAGCLGGQSTWTLIDRVPLPLPGCSLQRCEDTCKLASPPCSLNLRVNAHILWSAIRRNAVTAGTLFHCPSKAWHQPLCCFQNFLVEVRLKPIASKVLGDPYQALPVDTLKPLTRLLWWGQRSPPSFFLLGEG